MVMGPEQPRPTLLFAEKLSDYDKLEQTTVEIPAKPYAQVFQYVFLLDKPLRWLRSNIIEGSNSCAQVAKSR